MKRVTLEQYELFGLPSNRDVQIEAMAFKLEARNNLIEERLAGRDAKRAVKALASPSVTLTDDERLERSLARREIKRAEREAAKVAALDAERVKWEAWRPVCFGESRGVVEA